MLSTCPRTHTICPCHLLSSESIARVEQICRAVYHYIIGVKNISFGLRKFWMHHLLIVIFIKFLNFSELRFPHKDVMDIKWDNAKENA